jgi:hypothetical protein
MYLVAHVKDLASFAARRAIRKRFVKGYPFFSRSRRSKTISTRAMPASDLFCFEILVNGEPLEEYNPQQDDYNYPVCNNLPKSKLDRVCYVQEFPGSEFTARVTYKGTAELSDQIAYNVYLYVDGKEVSGRIFWEGKQGALFIINAKQVSGNLEQTYIVPSNHRRMKFSRIDFTEDKVYSGTRKESLGCIQLIVMKVRNVQFNQPAVAPIAASETSSLKVWEQDEKIAGKQSVATRYLSILLTL